MTENQSTSNPLSELLEAVGRETLPWERDKEPTVAGTVVDLSERTSEYGQYPVVALLLADGREVEVAGMGAVLQRFIMTCGVQAGDLFAVKYLGQRTPRSGGKPYHDYKVVVRNPDGTAKAKDQAAARSQPVDHVLDELDDAF